MNDIITNTTGSSFSSDLDAMFTRTSDNTGEYVNQFDNGDDFYGITTGDNIDLKELEELKKYFGETFRKQTNPIVTTTKRITRNWDINRRPKI